MQLISRFMRFFFYHFYHTFAWTYDFIAGLVSIGRWNDWIDICLPYIQGEQVLEIGYGSGHLQESILRRPETRRSVALDESRQMGVLAAHRLKNAGLTHANLVRGLAQSLPFAAGTFHTVVSTFPAEYIFEANTASDVHRVLHEGGCFIVLLAAWIVGRKFLDRGAAWLFRITGESPDFPHNVASQRLRHPFEEAGFQLELKMVEIRSSLVLIVIARR